MAFVAREWVLRNNHALIVEDLKFLIRHWVNIVLYHNIERNQWNNRFLNENIGSKIKQARLERVSSDIDLYEYILSTKQSIDKLII